MEKAITGAGVGLIVGLMAFLLIYQKNMDTIMAVPEPAIQAELAEGTLDGYDEEVDLVAYMLLQIQNQNLDYSLRGCAIEQVAEYFTMTYYVQYTEQYPDLELPPPSEYGSSAYEAIGISRMSNYYAVLLKEGFEKLSFYGRLELLSVVEDVPENADGKYYEHMREIKEILGARSVHEVIITVQTDVGALDMRWTIARYRRGWKVLLFTPLSEYKSKNWNMEKVWGVKSEKMETGVSEEDVLPVNYRFLGCASEEDPEELLRKFTLYLQKEDVWAAMAYYTFYDELPSVSCEYFDRQSQAAYEIQAFFYELFMPEGEYKAWLLRNITERAADLVEELSTAQIIYTNFSNFKVLSEEENQMRCRVTCSYNAEKTYIIFNLIYDNGWKIESIEL